MIEILDEHCHQANTNRSRLRSEYDFVYLPIDYACVRRKLSSHVSILVHAFIPVQSICDHCLLMCYQEEGEQGLRLRELHEPGGGSQTVEGFRRIEVGRLPVEVRQLPEQEGVPDLSSNDPGEIAHISPSQLFNFAW